MLGDLLPGVDAVVAGRLSGLLIQALRNLGPVHVNAARINHLRKTLPEEERRGLLKDIALAPAWMRPFFVELAGEHTAEESAPPKPSPTRKRRKALAHA